MNDKEKIRYLTKKTLQYMNKLESDANIKLVAAYYIGRLAGNRIGQLETLEQAKELIKRGNQ